MDKRLAIRILNWLGVKVKSSFVGHLFNHWEERSPDNELKWTILRCSSWKFDGIDCFNWEVNLFTENCLSLDINAD